MNRLGWLVTMVVQLMGGGGGLTVINTNVGEYNYEITGEQKQNITRENEFSEYTFSIHLGRSITRIRDSAVSHL